MAENKKSFILYADLIHNIDHLTNEEKGILFTHLLEYVNDLNPILEDRLLLTAWKPIERQLKRDLKSYELTKEERSKSGQLGNLKRYYPDLYKKVKSEELTLEAAQKLAKGRIARQSDTKLAVNGNVNVNVNDTVNVNENKKKSIEERKTEFYNSLPPLIDQKFTKKDARDFFEYWTEHGPNDKKMRFEKQTSFSLARRVSTWVSKKSQFQSSNKFQAPTTAPSFKNKI